MKLQSSLLALAISMALSATAANANKQNNNDNDQKNSSIQHVLLISVDGLHQTDLDWCVANNTCPNLANLVQSGVSFKNAQTPFPSDSFPGMVGQATGGNPKTTGVYYDDTWNRSLLPQGTTSCAGVTPGTEVYYTEANEPTIGGNITLDAGQGLSVYPIVKELTAGDPSSVPASILGMNSTPDLVRGTQVDPTQLPVDAATCKPVYSHQYVRVNTIFEVAKAHGLHTAWSDKHAAYEILNGPSGYGVDDLFAPEINSVVDPISNTNDWTKDNTNTQQYDTIKVAAVLNEINGKDHAGVKNTGVPAIFGMNFQAVSTAQKLNTSTIPTPVKGCPSDKDCLGGYYADGTPGPVLQSALAFVDKSLGQFQTAINGSSEANSTAIIVSAKHGQSPIKRADLKLIDDGNMIKAANAAWAAANPTAAQPLIAFAMDDDGILWWLNDRVNGPAFAKNFLKTYSTTAIGFDANSNATSVNVTSAGVQPHKIYIGAEAAELIGVSVTDDRYPDLIGIAQTGSVYAGGKLSKIAEHGGGNKNDRHVPLIISAPGAHAGKVFTDPVETTQIAPTILKLLGINASELQAVQIEHTQALQGLE